MSAISRRNALTAGAAALATGASLTAIAKTAEPDPVYAAIERCRLASAALVEACEDEPDRDDARYAEWHQRQDRAGDAESDACMALATLEPTTLAGIIAAITYVDEQTAGDDNVFDRDHFGVMLTATRNALVKLAAVQS